MNRKEMLTFRMNEKEKSEAKKLLDDIRKKDRYVYPEILLQALRMRKEMLKLSIKT